jgi:ELWxxDGT repeat protein
MPRHWMRRLLSRSGRAPAVRRRPAPRLEVLEDRTLLSVALLGDLNTTASASANPGGLVNLNGTAYFFANDGTHGNELWKSDGTGNGTQLVKDINPGAASSVGFPTPPVVLGGAIYFLATDGSHGFQVWKSNGTVTLPVTSFTTTATFGTIGALTAANGQLFFTTTGAAGSTLWVSSGAPGNATAVTDSGGNAITVTGGIGAVGSDLYFQGTAAAGGPSGLWKTDGTAAGTHFVQTLAAGSSISDVTDAGGTAYFVLTAFASGAVDTQLWASNGTSATELHDFGPAAGAAASDLTNVNGTLFFAADDHAASPDLGTELWKSNGTSAGTVMVEDVNPGAGSSLAFNADLTSFQGQLYFIANDGTHGAELYVSDGTAANTVPVTDGSGNAVASNALLSVVAGSTLYFQGSNAAGTGLWKTNGTAAGTAFVSPASVTSMGPGSSADVNGELFFTATDPAHGNELWKSNGTAAGTGLVKDINPSTDSNPQAFTAVGSTVFFVADDAVHGNELFKTDGTAGSAQLVKDINPGPGDAFDPFGTPDLANVGGTLYFFASDGNSADGAVQLWTSGGTAATTQLVKGFNPSTSNGIPSLPGPIADVNGEAFFAVDDGMHGTELWKSNGTAAGTVRVKDLNPGLADSDPTELTAVGSTLDFVATDGTNSGLWQTDGTTTTFLKAGASDLVNAGGTLYFTIDDATLGTQLWKLNGSVPTLVQSLGAGTTVSGPLVNAGGTLYFVATSQSAGPPATLTSTLWTSDGSALGTVALQSFSTTNLSASPQLSDLTAAGTDLYFINHNTSSAELWKSTGTAAGTAKVVDLPATDSTYQLVNVSGTLFFTAGDAAHGQELWRSDGTAAGTVLAADVRPGPQGSEPDNLTSAAGKAYFGADDGIHGVEPFAATPDTTNRLTTSTSLTPSATSVTQGTAVTFTAVVIPASGTIDGGTIDFKDGSTDLGSFSVPANGTVAQAFTLGVGTHDVIAYYSGDATYNSSASAGVSVTVSPSSGPVSTTTTLSASATTVTQGTPVTFTATVKPASGTLDGGSVDFKDGQTDLGSVGVSASGVVIRAFTLGVGSHSVTATYSGDANFQRSASGAVAVTVNPVGGQVATTTSLTASATTVTVGQPVTFTATVKPASGTLDGGSVDFKDGATDLGTFSVGATGVVQLTRAFNATGVHTVTAVYSGDATFGGSTSGAVAVTVNPGAGTVTTTTTLSASATSVPQGTPVTFTATVTPASGTLDGGSVDFKDGATDLGSFAVPANGLVAHAFTLGAGTHDVIAIYTGDATYAGSTSTAVSVTVLTTSGTTTTTSLSASSGTVTVGQPVTLTATVAPASGTLDGGTVDFKDGQTDLGSVPIGANGVATLTPTLTQGTHTLTAVYTGDAAFGGSASQPVTVTANPPVGTTTALSASASSIALGQSVMFTATVKPPTGNVDGGSVDFRDGSVDLGSSAVDANGVATLSVALSPEGSHTVTAVYSGDVNFVGSTSNPGVTVTVKAPTAPVATTTTLTVSPTSPTAGQPVTLSAAVAFVGSAPQPVDGGSVSFLDGGVLLATMPVNPATGTATLTTALSPGLHNLTAVYGGDPLFKASTSPAVPVTVAFPPPVTGDVTPVVQVTLTPVPRRRKAQAFAEVMTIHNVGGAPLQGPLNVVLRNLRGAIKVRGVSGFVGPRRRRSPFVLVNLPGSVLMPNDSISVMLQFTGRPNFFRTSVFAADFPQ